MVIAFSLLFKHVPTFALPSVMCASVPRVVSVEQHGHLWADLAFQLSCKAVCSEALSISILN